MTHTPGPWLIEDESEGVVWVASENPPPRDQFWTTAKCGGPNAQANARLIASAPELLDALYTVKFTLESVKPSTTVGELLDLWETVSTVIAKAEDR